MKPDCPDSESGRVGLLDMQQNATYSKVLGWVDSHAGDAAVKGRVGWADIWVMLL